MSNADIIKENQILKEEIEKLNKELTETREHLKKYTSPFYKKIYYENNKEQIKEIITIACSSLFLSRYSNLRKPRAVGNIFLPIIFQV